MLRILLIIAAAITLGAASFAAEDGPVSSPEALASAAPNTWTVIHKDKTGGRDQPIFVYAEKIKRFVAAAGMQAWGGGAPRHYDTEEFDLKTCKWINAYPPGMEKGRPESGPVGAEYTKQRMMHGHHGRKPFYKDGEYLRITSGGQWNNARAYGEYCYVPENGKIYAYMWNRTLCYDVAGRTWEDLKATRDKCRIWGAMCYDPVNKEILHAGGAGGSADIGTWVYDIGKNEWRKLEFGSPELKQLHKQSKDLRWQAKDLLGRVSSRFAIAETADEAKADLVALAERLAAAAEKVAAAVESAGLKGGEKTAGVVAAQRLAAAVDAVKAAGPRLGAALTAEHIVEVRTARVLFEQVVDALSPEPPGRARSQIAYDPVHKKIVLFGGDGLDRVLSDTWVYDCATRTWEQRFPKRCPAPRAGHILGWLSKGKKIVLGGGYSRVALAQEIWTYDTGANEWQLLMHVPLKKGRHGSHSPGCPNVTARDVQQGALNEDDVLVCQRGKVVWACKVDAAKADAEGTAAQSVETGTYVFNRISPASWEKAAQPDATRTKTFLDGLPVNQWTAFTFPRYAPGARNRWGTTAYDTDRHQFLFWGGGHATSHENDVAHFSVRGGFWTIGYHPDDPIERVYATQPTPLSFNDRVHVPIHAYKAYCYDPTAKLMFYFNRGYDPLVREWVPAAFPGLSHRGPMRSQMESTPEGAVVLSSKGLFRFDAGERQWRKLPQSGAKLGGTYCDGPGLCYDSKRNCLWSSGDKVLVRYDLATGQGTKIKIEKPKILGRWIFHGEEQYIPGADLILLMNLFKKPGGDWCNVAWSPEQNKYFWVELPFVAGDKPVKFKRTPFSWHDAMHYDRKFDLVLINNSSAQRVWVMKFDAGTAKMTDIIE